MVSNGDTQPWALKRKYKSKGVLASWLACVLVGVFGSALAAPAKESAAPAAQSSDEQTCQAKNYAAHQADAANPYWPQQAPVQRLNDACWIRAETLASAMVGMNKPQLIDVRPRSAQKASPLPGAMQLDLSDLASKQFLRQESLVLVGTGLDYSTLGNVCETLGQQGFVKVQVVRGGVGAWQSVAPSNGAASTDKTALQAIDAAEWIASLGQGIRWTVLSASDALQKIPQEQWPVPKAQVVNFQAEGKERDAKLAVAAARAYQDARKKLQQSPTPEAVIIVPDAAMKDLQRLQFEQALNDAAPEKPGSQAAADSRLPVYWLQGGWQGYEQQVAQNAAIQQTASHRLQVPCGRI